MSPLSDFWLYIRQTYGEFIFALAFGAKIGGGAISRWRSAPIFSRRRLRFELAFGG